MLLVTNPSNFKRSEIVTIDIASLKLNSGINPNTLVIKSAKDKTEMQTQFVDSDSDGIFDKILFQPFLKANGKREFKITTGEASKLDAPKNKTFACFVPERIDDFAWENNKVAFRTYGPIAQKMTEEGTPGGIISSGMDCWLKRVKYPVINK